MNRWSLCTLQFVPIFPSETVETVYFSYLSSVQMLLQLQPRLLVSSTTTTGMKCHSATMGTHFDRGRPGTVTADVTAAPTAIPAVCCWEFSYEIWLWEKWCRMTGNKQLPRPAAAASVGFASIAHVFSHGPANWRTASGTHTLLASIEQKC